MKQSIVLFFLTLSLMASAQPSGMKTFHDFTVTDIYGKEISLSTFKGKKVLVVNVASECGLTPQYKELQQLYDRYQSQDFVVIAFPANNFGAQEPGTNEEIQAFCQKNYGVTFPVMAKISVLGEDMHPLYKWLTQSAENGKWDSDVKWNFQKYLINENGEWMTVITPRENPMSENIIRFIEGK